MNTATSPIALIDMLYHTQTTEPGEVDDHDSCSLGTGYRRGWARKCTNKKTVPD